MYPEQLVRSAPRSADDGAVRVDRPGGLPARLPVACAAAGHGDVVVNGVDYRVRTIPVEQQGGVLMSIGIRADSILLNRARIPFYTAVGVVTVLIAAGLGWLLAGPAIRPLRRLTEHTTPARQGHRGDARGARRPRGRGTVRGDDGDAEPAGRRSAGDHQFAAGRSGFRRERGARVAHPADRDARRPGHAAHPRPASRRAGRGGRTICRGRSAASRRSSPRSVSWPPASSRRPRTASSSTSPTCSTGWRGRTCAPAARGDRGGGRR